MAAPAAAPHRGARTAAPPQRQASAPHARAGSGGRSTAAPGSPLYRGARIAALPRRQDGAPHERDASSTVLPRRQDSGPASAGRQDHDHLPTFEFRLLLDLGEIRYVAFDAFEQLNAE